MKLKYISFINFKGKKVYRKKKVNKNYELTLHHKYSLPLCVNHGQTNHFV